jgi:5-formyltetrahydrofolate cyclo-ligase
MNQAAKAYWQKYVDSLVDKPINPKVSASYAGSREITDSLVQVYLEGKKSAASSLMADYVTTGDPLPQIGNYWIVLDSQDIPRCICKTIRIEITKFKDVGEEIARAEGEGDLSLEYWRKAHLEFFEPFLDPRGVKDIWEEDLVTEFFEVSIL